MTSAVPEIGAYGAIEVHGEILKLVVDMGKRRSIGISVHKTNLRI
jgi:hypothetical protein